jgi:hypothetical protein
MKLRRLVPVVLLATAVVAVGACGSDSSSAGSSRPTTTAHLAIVQPTPNATTGPQVSVQLQLTGGTIAPVSGNLKLEPNTGHIHLYLDNQLISMSQNLTQTLPTLNPGLHTVRAEFVANDHLPWANRSQVTSEVAFTVT